MKYEIINRVFPLKDNQHCNAIYEFWQEMLGQYGKDQLVGIAHSWKADTMSYGIGLKTGDIVGSNMTIDIPSAFWAAITCEFEDLPNRYTNLLTCWRPRYTMETFDRRGGFVIRYHG